VAVPGHGAILEPDALQALIERNANLAEQVATAVLEITAAPRTAEEVLQQLLTQFGAPAVDAPSFYLLQPTALAFLSHLQREGRVTHEVREGRSLWRRT
jgi:hypothetical protein